MREGEGGTGGPWGALGTPAKVLGALGMMLCMAAFPIQASNLPFRDFRFSTMPVNKKLAGEGGGGHGGGGSYGGEGEEHGDGEGDWRERVEEDDDREEDGELLRHSRQL